MSANMIAETLMEKTRKGELTWSEIKSVEFNVLEDGEYWDGKTYSFETKLNDVPVHLTVVCESTTPVGVKITTHFYRVGLEAGSIKAFAKWNDKSESNPPEDFAVARDLIKIINPNSPALQLLPPVSVVA